MYEYEIIDLTGEGVNELYCSCGEQLYPDCDVSRVSIAEEFDRHIQKRHSDYIVMGGRALKVINTPPL